jgi:menaquinone-dependent protoporphyrinogen IX oxidase
MQRIARSQGQSAETDTSHDVEFTNWDQVTHFAQDFVKLVEAKSDPVVGL